MANSLNYKIGIDNIFDFSFMDDFYSFIENKVYSEKDLFKKFNIRKVTA